MDLNGPFEQSENLFEIKDCDIKLPLDTEFSCLSFAVQIKKVYMLQYNLYGDKYYAMVV